VARGAPRAATGHDAKTGLDALSDEELEARLMASLEKVR
jgi:hypothetical protein